MPKTSGIFAGLVKEAEDDDDKGGECISKFKASGGLVKKIQVVD